MIRLVVERSCGGIEELHVAKLKSDASLQFLAQSRLTCMKVLSIPESEVTADGFCELILTLPALVHLDLSNCRSILSNYKALEVIGQTCKSFMDWLDRSYSIQDMLLGLDPESTWREAISFAEWFFGSDVDEERQLLRDIDFGSSRSLDGDREW
ncbi:hypothetical protein R1flu_013671 [Riccia fluitans]|uniref:F-box/LRR-repeat protein n=1 Tax=Riccia fluitans TaxID=41844 RepID=A0ABD1YE79_9MARC